MIFSASEKEVEKKNAWWVGVRVRDANPKSGLQHGGFGMRSLLILGQVGGCIARASHDCLPNPPLIQALLVLVHTYTSQRTSASFPSSFPTTSRMLTISLHHFLYRVRNPRRAKTSFQNYHLTVFKNKGQRLAELTGCGHLRTGIRQEPTLAL